MSKTWDLSSTVRGKVVIALLTMTTIFAGAQALAPSMASAERVDCSNEEDREACEDGSPSGGTDDAGSTADPGGTSTPQPGAGNTVPPATTNQDVDPINESFDDPTKPDPAVERALNGIQPALRSLDPSYIGRLAEFHLLDPKLRSVDDPGDLPKLTDDCYQLSSMIGTLDDRVDSLKSEVNLTYGKPGGKRIQKAWERTQDRRSDRATEYRRLECGTVLSLDGRD